MKIMEYGLLKTNLKGNWFENDIIQMRVFFLKENEPEYFHLSLYTIMLSDFLEMQVWSLVWGDALDEGMATHSNNLAWKIS